MSPERFPPDDPREWLNRARSALAKAKKGVDIEGVMIMASHNPPRYNGLKVKAAHGGPASAEVMQRIETYLSNPKSQLPIFLSLNLPLTLLPCPLSLR